MLGREELDKLSRRKQVLLLESSLNRLVLQGELKSMRSASSWLGEVTRSSREFAPALLALAPFAGFFLARGSRRSDSWFKRVVGAAKWILPLYRLWKNIAAGQKTTDADEPAA
ncbi:MAG: hypothetical protein WCQ21_26710 [Verrucomicrobiota bacterium]